MHLDNETDDHRDAGRTSRPLLLDLRLELSEPRPLSSERQRRWAGLLSIPGAAPDAPYLLFLGELLEILDPGESCTFACEAYSLPGEPGRTAWRLATRRMSLSLEQERGRGQRGVSRIVTAGFPAGLSLEWDGRLDGLFPMAVVVGGITAAQEECLLDLAHELFARAEAGRFIPPSLSAGDFWGGE